MPNSSEYQFPIFISSTDYNLIDLRAELSQFLTEIGYRPILSSSEGFHDKSPNLEPWESCLPVLDTCFVTILIIDGRYSSALPWPNYPKLPSQNIRNRKNVSPTHGEYLYAHKMRKRMLVFVRSDVMTHYQSYRTAIKNCKSKLDAEKALKLTLPKTIDFKTLDFLHEVKTTKPIPWIKVFDDVTSVKKEIHKKMLNEFAEVFLIKERHFDTVVEVFDRAMDELTEDKQKKILEKINATKNIANIKVELASRQKELKEVKVKLEAEKEGNKEVDQAKTEKIKKLERKINRLETEINSDDNLTEKLLIQTDGKIRINTSNHIFNDDLQDNIIGNYSNSLYGFLDNNSSKQCSKCKKEVGNEGFLLTGYDTLNKCSFCNKKYCSSCWPNSSLSGFYGINKCPNCSEK